MAKQETDDIVQLDDLPAAALSSVSREENDAVD
jgi:hypothetical protein